LLTPTYDLRTSGMNSVLIERGAGPVAGTPEEFGAFIRSETVRLKKMIELADIQAE